MARLNLHSDVFLLWMYKCSESLCWQHETSLRLNYAFRFPIINYRPFSTLFQEEKLNFCSKIKVLATASATPQTPSRRTCGINYKNPTSSCPQVIAFTNLGAHTRSAFYGWGVKTWPDSHISFTRFPSRCVKEMKSPSQIHRHSQPVTTFKNIYSFEALTHFQSTTS